MVTTGRLAYYEELKAATPPGLVAMLDIPGLGPKKIKMIHDELEAAWVDSLRRPRTPPTQLASNTAPAEAEPARRVVSRQTAPLYER